ncbi:MAG: hypothetical protein JWO82_2221 [Akkermansiaceae bacterium]|nr:hypothetical protein [Akkermansiaceae bacterium]
MALLLPLFSLNSCVMLSVMGAHRETSSQLDLQGGKDHAEIKGKPTEASRGKHRNPTRKEVVAAWGEPKEKRPEADGGETWIWRRGATIWTGMLGVVGIVPVPLALPLSREGMEVKFGPGDGPAVEWTDIERGQASAGIGLTPDLEGGDYSRRHHGIGFGRNDFEKRWMMDRPAVDHEIKGAHAGGSRPQGGRTEE